MRILAADTSAMSGSLALLDDENLTAEWTLRSGKTHNRRLLKSIDSILREAGWDLGTIDAFAVASGPGSFTGLRIGMATMKVLAWVRAKAYASICSLDALALPLCFSTDQYALFSAAERVKCIAHVTGLMGKATSASRFNIRR